MGLDERVDAFLQRQDPADILDDRALIEADALRAAGNISSAAHRSLGLFHYFRYVSLPYGSGADDWRLALQSFLAAGNAPRPVSWLLNSASDALTAYLIERNANAARIMTSLRAHHDAGQLDTTLDGLRGLAKVALVDAPVRVDILSNFCAALWTRYERSGHLTDLDEGAAVARDLVSSERPGALANAALLLGARYGARYDQRDLDDQIEVLKRAVALVSSASSVHHELHHYCGDLAQAMRNRFELGLDAADLECAIDLYHRALEAAPAGHPDDVVYLAYMGECLVRRFRYSNDPDDLHRAVEAGRRALGRAERTGPVWAEVANRVGGTLIERFARLGDPRDVDDGLDLQRASIADPAAAGSRLPTYLINYGHGLLRSYAWRGAKAELDAAIDAVRRALPDVPAAAPDHPLAANVLSVALYYRFELRGHSGDLAGAIDACRIAISSLSVRNPRRASYLSNLGVLLRRDFTRAGAADALDEAVVAATEAVRSTDPEDANQPRYLNNLGIALHERYARDKVEADLDQAIDALRQAVDNQAPGSPERAIYLTNLANSLRDRGSAQRAVEYAEEALAATAATDVERCSRLLALGAALADSGRRQLARRHLREGASLRTAPADHRMRAATAWANMTDGDEKLTALIAVVELLPELAWHGLDRTAQEQRIRDYPLLAGQAAAHAIDGARPGPAVELLELGRTVIWSHLVRARTPLARLEDAHPRLAERLVSVRRLLDGGSAPEITDPA